MAAATATFLEQICQTEGGEEEATIEGPDMVVEDAVEGEKESDSLGVVYSQWTVLADFLDSLFQTGDLYLLQVPRPNFFCLLYLLPHGYLLLPPFHVLFCIRIHYFSLFWMLYIYLHLLHFFHLM